MDMTDNNHTPAPIPKRKFKAQIVFENGQGANFDCEAIDHLSALAKLAGGISDYPLRVIKMQFWDSTEHRIISVLPGLRHD